jgi:hypothetical protein
MSFVERSVRRQKTSALHLFMGLHRVTQKRLFDDESPDTHTHTLTMTIHTEAKINLKMAPNWLWNRFPGELGTAFGIALRSILKMLRDAVQGSPEVQL